ncbi:uncharacterized protein LOC118189656 [Stegodyphus dumicola]|uniref:uncharacterized protein LOC118189656 n=1 Tax=Stegodyphus dumicola TaxID=202533 RepID=UPI0015AF0C1E|nr:uncharacterized protein LOC118189656 [Stegodyphus dumicola]
MYKNNDWVPLLTITVIFACLAVVYSYPLNSKAAGWMSSTGEDSRSYSHLGGDSKFSKGVFSSHPPRSSFQTGANTANKTLAAILLMAVFGLGATALLVILCSKMAKKEEYDSVKGSIY